MKNSGDLRKSWTEIDDFGSFSQAFCVLDAVNSFPIFKVMTFLV